MNFEIFSFKHSRHINSKKQKDTFYSIFLSAVFYLQLSKDENVTNIENHAKPLVKQCIHAISLLIYRFQKPLYTYMLFLWF